MRRQATGQDPHRCSSSRTTSPARWRRPRCWARGGSRSATPTATVIDLDTRELPPDEAARRIQALDGRITFKKIDSLLRGNVQAEIEALTGEVIVAPALPVEGRTVRGGVLHVHGVPQPTPP